MVIHPKLPVRFVITSVMLLAWYQYNKQGLPGVSGGTVKKEEPTSVKKSRTEKRRGDSGHHPPVHSSKRTADEHMEELLGQLG